LGWTDLVKDGGRVRERSRHTIERRRKGCTTRGGEQRREEGNRNTDGDLIDKRNINFALLEIKGRD
jgi:hypothetical protein